MRLNRFLANHSSLSRRRADELIAAKRVEVNGKTAELGQSVEPGDQVLVDRSPVKPIPYQYLALNKPIGYICSRRQQGQTPTIYSLLPPQYHHLKSVGRLDGDSSGLLLLTNDGGFAEKLLHPRYHKTKRYQVTLDRSLNPSDRQRLETGVALSDGSSHLQILSTRQGKSLIVALSEGRNRQIRRTFAALNYKVILLTRLAFGRLELSDLPPGQYRLIEPAEVI